MKKSAIKLALLGLTIGFCAAHYSVSAETVSSFTKESDGALCQLSGGTKLKLQVCGDNIIRVVYMPASQTTIPAPQGLVVGKTSFSPGTFDATDNGTAIVVTTPKVTATVSKATALVAFSASTGGAVCTETARTLSAVTKGGQAGYSGTLNFNSPADEGVYGLGNLSLKLTAWGNNGGTSYWEIVPPDQTGQLNIRPFTFDMHQANWYDVIPFFMTTSGYGVLMNFCCHAKKTTPLNFSADFLLNNSWDYFFIYGPQFDTIISGYRNITGPAPLPSKWAFGYWQCKNRYESSSQLSGVVDTFRSKNIPVDCIVQDWEWWTNGNTGWGTFVWDSPYANPKTWIDNIHTKNAHLALSIWETFSAGTPHYTSLSSHLVSCVSNGGTFLNIFDSTAAGTFWGYMNDVCYSNGVDAWWMDATEPECAQLTGTKTDLGVIDMYSNAYALASAKSIYERQRAVSTAKRVVNLTRSFYAGQQRFGTMYWNGDISSSDIGNVATTVSGGINSCMAGNPYWCSDIGGFQANNGPLSDEILTRWFEAGTFFPIFRTHGTRATEIYNMNAAPKQTCTYYDILRYRLMPYIYSLAWMVTSQNYTITRALPFDFPNDASVKNIANQYMFGPALMINPVTTAGANNRTVYLPSGTWYDFWTGASIPSGNVNASAPLQTIPIYARAGAILPMGPKIQYATQSSDPIELRVYPGANGSFTLYEDEGDGYNYESGKYATIPITYIDKPQNLIIGARSGSFTGMLASRTFKVVFVKANHGIADTITADPDFTLNYTGAATSTTGVPVSIQNNAIDRLQSSLTLKTAENSLVLSKDFAGKSKSIGVYDLGGKLIAMKTLTANAINLRKDLGVPSGIYIVKVKTLP
jgi:alpha-D-xyloside xylohydrolase